MDRVHGSVRYGAGTGDATPGAVGGVGGGSAPFSIPSACTRIDGLPKVPSGGNARKSGRSKGGDVVFGVRGQSRKISELSSTGWLMDLLPPNVTGRLGKTPKLNESNPSLASLVASDRGDEAGEITGTGAMAGSPEAGATNRLTVACVSIE